MMEKKVCIECGIAFVPMARNQITCSKECSLKRRRRREKAWREEEYKSYRKTCKENQHTHSGKCREKRKAEARRRKPGRSLAETAALARAAGMSYGQYMARMRMS